MYKLWTNVTFLIWSFFSADILTECWKILNKFLFLTILKVFIWGTFQVQTVGSDWRNSGPVGVLEEWTSFLCSVFTQTDQQNLQLLWETKKLSSIFSFSVSRFCRWTLEESLTLMDFLWSKCGNEERKEPSPVMKARRFNVWNRCSPGKMLHSASDLNLFSSEGITGF